jgi:hypothetical protein
MEFPNKIWKERFQIEKSQIEEEKEEKENVKKEKKKKKKKKGEEKMSCGGVLQVEREPFHK